MADTTPLLSETHSSENQSKEPPASLDEVIELCIGGSGFVHLIQAIIVSFAWVFDAQQTFISVFTEAEPSWHYTTRHHGNYSTCEGNICCLPRDSWTWDRPTHSSVISDWDLQCASSFVKGLPASSFFMGCLAGGLVLASLADSSLGRKSMLFVSCLVMSFASLLTFFSPNIWVYSLLKFINGFGRATIGTCALVLSTELVGKRWRGKVGVVGFFCFTLGFLSLPAVAYLNRDSSWRTLYLWTSIPTIFYCFLVYFTVPESPRWLFVRGRKEEAVSILAGVAPLRSGSFTSKISNLDFKQESSGVDMYSAITTLVEKRWAFRRLATVMIMGFGIGLVYYGIPLGLGNLNFNLYMSVTFNAISELPAAAITFFLINTLNRRSSSLVFCSLSGICSVLCVVSGQMSSKLQIGFELVSFFCACTAFNIVMIYTIELFPTSVRNSALSMVRQALVFGGMFSPVLVAAGRTNGFLTYGVFGLAIGICGLFAVLLPETRGAAISDTLDQEEHIQSLLCSGQQEV